MTAARRRLTGLSDALNTAHAELVAALREHSEVFEAALDLDQTARREPAAELIAELAENIAQGGEPEAALRWLRLALDDRRSWLGLPQLHVPERQVIVQGQPLQLAHVLRGLREAA